MTPVFEPRFSDHSYGFRPGRSTADAIQAAKGFARQGKDWVVDLDITKFFDKLQHDWLVRFVEHRVGDKRVVRLIQKWLKAGVVEDGRWFQTEEGSPQGSVISPILANLYLGPSHVFGRMPGRLLCTLHYVLDLWAKAWRKTRARGEMIMVRYADDGVLECKATAQAYARTRGLALGFERREDADLFLEQL